MSRPRFRMRDLTYSQACDNIAATIREKRNWNPEKPYVNRVHAVRAGNFIKIGASCNVPQRMGNLQTASAHELSLIGVLYGGMHLERLLHERFREHRVRGEWFTLRVLPDLLELIESDERFFQRRVYFDVEAYEAQEAA